MNFKMGYGSETKGYMYSTFEELLDFQDFR